MTRVGVLASRWFLSALLVVGAALFLVGVAAERSNTHTDVTGPAVTATTAPAAHVEGSASEEGETATTATEPAGHTETPGHVETAVSSESNEGHVLGVNLESNGVVAVGVIISLTLAALVWWRRSKMLLVAVVAFAVAFAIFDIAEVAHQANTSHGGVAALAGLVALAHLATAAIAVVLLVSRPSIVSPAGTAT